MNGHERCAPLRAGAWLIRGLVTFAVIALIGANIAPADVITFDPDGTAPANSSSRVSTFDFLPGNSLFRGIGSLLVNKTDQPTTNYVQARMGNLLDANGDPIVVTGMNTNFELTVVVTFDSLAKVAGGNTTYKLDPGAIVKSFQVFYDDFSSGVQADDLAGTGFNDGKLILSGTLTDASGIVSKVGSNSLFDRFGPDNYSGLQTVRVSGGASLDVNVSLADADFFGGAIVAKSIQVSLYNQSNVTPFNQVNPSQEFLGYSPSRLPINGTGDDFQVQADPTSSFVVSAGGDTPEPSTLVLGGLGLVAFLGVARRRRKSA